MLDISTRIANLPPSKRKLLELALGNRDESQSAKAICKRSPGDEIPLSFAQQRLWFLDQLEPNHAAYHLAGAVRIEGPLQVDVLEKAFNEVVKRHEILRTTFTSGTEDPVQIIASELTVNLPLVDLQHLPESDREAEISRLATECAQRPFVLSEGPLLRARLLQVSETEHLLLLTLHHIIADGWSVGILIRELSSYYQREELEELPVQYGDYAVWQREWLQGEKLAAELGYWREQLAGAPAVLSLPTDHVRPAVQSFRGGRERLELGAGLLRGLQQLSQEQGATLFMTLLGAFQVLLWRLSGQRDVLVGTPIANRQRRELEGLIGFFANTLVLRTQVAGGESFRELLARVKETCLGAYGHQDVPFEKLVEELQPERSLSHSPIFQVMFILQNAPQEEMGAAGLSFNVQGLGTQAAKFDLTLTLSESASGLQGWLEYNSDLFAASTIARMGKHFECLLESIVADADQVVGALEVLPPAEREQLLREWNDTSREYASEQCVQQLIEAQVEQYADAAAVRYEDETITYQELNQRANRLAHHLRKLGVGPEVVVGICIERSVEMVVGLLGILKAGGAYLPLDPAYPQERLDFMLAQSEAPVLVTMPGLGDRFVSFTGQQVLINDAELDHESELNPECTITPENLCYVIYTSGSTGQPKGVMITHRSVVNLLSDIQSQLSLSERDTLLAVTTISFDIAGLELYLPLLAGAAVHVASRNILSDGDALSRLILSSEATVMQATPTTWRMLEETGWQAPPSFKVLCGGEALDLDLARSLTGKGIEAWNVYGPTETTIWSTIAGVAQFTDRTLIGRPLANTEIYLLDEQLNVVPVGVPGELFIGGDGLARGYHKRADLAAEKFIPHPYSQTPGARLYRTGDMARYLPNGEIECLGRLDRQVKLRGFRIELEEIEAVLKSHSQVIDGAVVLSDARNGDKRLVGYVVPSAEFNNSELRRYLGERLPEYMVPGVIEELEALPLTANGKVDRARLPEPSAMRREGGTEYQAARSPLEAGLVEIWEQLLRVERVGIHDNFFALGGHSLLATRLMSRVRETFGKQLPLRRLFEHPTVAQLAEELQREAGEASVPALVKVERGDGLPLSFAQQRLWFLDQLEPGSTAYNMPGAIRISGALDVAALERSLAAVVNRHESLRSRFEEREGQPRQVIAADVKIELRALDLTALEEEERAVRVQQLVAQEAQSGFVLSEGPLLRARLLQVSETEHLLLLTLHHIIADGWSVGILIRELSSYYQREVSGGGEELEELPIQYGDYAVWQREWLQGEKLAAELGYWREQLAGAPAVLSLPTDHVRPAVQSFRGGRERLELGAELLRGLQQLSQEQGATLFMTLLGAFQVLLWRLSGQRDVVVGTPIANRQRQELEGLIGFFANTLVLRTQVAGGESFRELLGRVKETCLGAYGHQDVPFEKLVEELQPERSLSHSPLFQVAFVLQNEPTQKLEIPGLVFDYMAQEDQRAKFDLIMTLTEVTQGLKATLEYNADLFESSTARRMLSGFQTLLEGLVAQPQTSVAELPLLTETDQHELVTRWNPAPIESAFEAPVFRSFEQQVKRTPHAIAVICGAEYLTYAELNSRANRLACHLNQMGVEPEVPVGLYSTPSLQRVIGLFGILKSGGVCVPLDGTTDYQRLDMSYPVVVTHDELSLAIHDARIVSIDSLLDEVDGSEENPNNTIAPENLAYRIDFGSSQIEVEHRALARAISDCQSSYSFSTEDVLLHLAAGDQHTAIHEILWPLLCGGRLVIASADEAKDKTALSRLMSNERVSVVNLVPQSLENLLESSRVYVLDQHGQLVPLGVSGEIYVGGPALARGYAGDVAGTASRFIPDSFSGIPGERLWRTAEAGRRLHDGRLERLGPMDRQVWIQGYLVDLVEVEMALLQSPTVNECAVLARVSDQGTQLVAYVVTNGFFQPERLNSFLQDKLRQHMIPSCYVPVTRIPLTEDGEVDEQELARVPVLDSSVLSAWEEQLSSLPDIEQVAVVIREADEPTAELDLTELVPQQPRPARVIEASQNESVSISSSSDTRTPAISHGQPLNEENLAATLIEALQGAAQNSPADSIVYHQADGKEIAQSYAELLEEAERILGSLRELGLNPQYKVIFQLDLNQDFIPAFWACVLGGFVPVPISIAPIYEESNSTVTKLLNSWKMLDQPLVLASREIAPALNSLTKQLGMQDFAVAMIDNLRDGSADKDYYAAKPDDVALILLTSGSTGMPKGVVQTHKAILGRSAATAQMNNFSSADVSLNWFPLDHVGGLVMFHVRDVCVGARQIQVPTHAILSDPLKWLDLLERHHVTITWAPNFAYGLINDRLADKGSRHWDLSRLRFVLNGGEAVVARTARRFLELLAPYGLPATSMHPAWGMSETCSGVTYSDRFTRELTSDDDSFVEVGGPVPGISIRITDAQDQLVSEETIGRLQVRGISVLSQYYNNPEVNRQSFTQDGWFITGDIGFLRDGRLTITGREKDVIIVNGANFYSHEIEAVVEEIEGVEVSFTAACAISQPGSDTDRLAIFFNTQSSDWLPLINEIRQRVVRSIGVNAEFVIPVEKDDIPKTAIGKIQRSQLVERFEQGDFELVLKQIELQSGRSKTLPDWFFKKTWRRGVVRTLPRNTAGSILILCDNAGLAQQVRIGLQQPSVMVEAGDEFSRLDVDSYRINPSNPDNYRQLIQSLANDQVQVSQIVHLWTYTEYEGEATSQAQLDKAQDPGLYSLLYLVQALDPEIQDEEKRIHMMVASTHSQSLSSTDIVAYEKSTMFGLLKTLPLERQWLSCSHIDLPIDAPSVNAARLLKEITNITVDDEVAYREGQRWVSQLEKVNLRRQPLQDLPFKFGGLYLLTGGLGGIGVEIARYLLKHFEARLILVGRTPMDQTVAEALEELKRLGGDVAYESVDISNLEQLQRVVAEVEGRWNSELDGVIHLAGSLGEQLIEQATRESVSATLRAKVFGTWALHELLKPRRKDVLFISFSSVNSFFGGVTVGAYAAANSFLETFMQYRRNHGWSNSYSYSWSLWDETGMTRGYLLKDLSRARGYYAISTEQGVSSWLAGLHRGETQLLIGLDGGNRSISAHLADVPCVRQKVTAYFTTVGHVQVTEAAVQDRFQHPVDCEFVHLSEMPLKENGEIDLEKLSGLGASYSRLSSDDDEPASDTEVQLCKIWQELLAVQRVGRYDNFFQLGGHSLLSMQLISRLRDTFQIELPLRTLFESSTVVGLAEQIDNILWLRQDHGDPLASIGSQHEEGIL